VICILITPIHTIKSLGKLHITYSFANGYVMKHIAFRKALLLLMLWSQFKLRVNGAFLNIANIRTCQNKNYTNILHMFSLLISVFDTRFVLDEIHGNNIIKTLKLLCMGEKITLTKTFMALDFLWWLKPWCFFLDTCISRGSSFPSMSCPP